MKSISRRNFIKKTALMAGTLAFVGVDEKIMATSLSPQSVDNLQVSIFSKHLQFLDFKSLGENVAKMGFTGIDLTVRKGGHVEPSTVKIDLPKAIREIEKGGSKVTMIATAIENVNNPLDVDILTAASTCGIKYYRPNWLKFQTGKPMVDSLEVFTKQLKELSLLNKNLGIVGCYQNHAGTLVGGSLWEVYKILELVD